jgi:hypothetical protein
MPGQNASNGRRKTGFRTELFREAIYGSKALRATGPVTSGSGMERNYWDVLPRPDGVKGQRSTKY